MVRVDKNLIWSWQNMTNISGVNRHKITISDIKDNQVIVTCSDEGNRGVQDCASGTPSRAPIKMIYRGWTYNYDPEQARANHQIHPINQAPYDLICRGVTYHIDPNVPKPPSTMPRNYELIYRGCTYQVTRNEAGAVMAITLSTKSFKR
jgi:Domain of unknown function (DUF4278)